MVTIEPTVQSGAVQQGCMILHGVLTISAVLSNIITARIRHGKTKLTKKLTDPARLELALPNT